MRALSPLVLLALAYDPVHDLPQLGQHDDAQRQPDQPVSEP